MAAGYDDRVGGHERARDPPVGFNPFRKQRRSTIDIAVVALFVVITLAAVLWGFFG